MNFINRISRKVFSALDFEVEKVSVWIGENKNGQPRSLGLGQAPSRGIRQGQVTHTGDAVESVVEALQEAERQAGTSVGTLYYNFTDPALQCLVSRGSKTLKGEGQIRAADLKEVRQAAERLVGHFERNIIYSRETGYTIDERDFVANPLGVFGRKLDVQMRILTATSALCDTWQKIMSRAGVKRSVRVASAWSTAYGILPKEDREIYRLIVDSGGSGDFLNIFIFGNNMICDHRVVLLDPGTPVSEEGFLPLLAAAKELLTETFPVEKILVAGRQNSRGEISSLLRKSFDLPVSEVSPRSVQGLENLSQTGLVGLLAVADELENKNLILHHDKDLMGTLKEKTATFLSDYF